MTDRVQTGSRVLDAALAGGLPRGASLLVSGEEGAGATEFALTVLKTIAGDKSGHKARFVSAMRSAPRVTEEMKELFEEPKPIAGLDIVMMASNVTPKDAENILSGLDKGDVLVIESADSLAVLGDGYGLIPFWRALGNEAAARGITVLLLHAHGTLPMPVEHALAQIADGVLRFTWHDGGPSHRRQLEIPKLRGLAPVLDGDQVPIFEVALSKGVGFTVSRERSLV